MVMSGSELMFQIGSLMLIAFIGALIASRFKQSVIIGYLVVGILIGPYISFDLGPISYHGLVKEMDFISFMSQIGIVLLIFFVGLEFSFEKIKRIKGPASLLAIVDVGVCLFSGFLLAAYLGWPLLDAVFLSAILAMSCSAVAMKALIDLGRLERTETEFMLGMIIMEEFISMVFLTVVGGLMIKVGPDFALINMIVGMVAFFAVFVVLAVLVIPRSVRYLKRIKSREMLVLFALAIVCLSAAFAEICGVPPLIGAFFIGMVFADTQIVQRIESTLAPVRDAFVAIFFVSFGMLIDLGQLGQIMGIAIVAAVIILIDEIVIMSSIAYLIGFSRRAAVSLGSAFTARGGESILYASVGSQSVGVTKGAELYPIAGVVTFIMSSLCPILIKKSYQLADGVARFLPRPITYAGALVSRTLGRAMQRSAYSTKKLSKRFFAALIVYLVLLVATASTEGTWHLLCLLLAASSTIILWRMMSSEIAGLALGVDYSGLGAGRGSNRRIANFVVTLLSSLLAMCVGVAFLFNISWLSVVVFIVGYVILIVALMVRVHRSTFRAERPSKIAALDG
jgi:CPA2 family monovalent cation:H+ antiporter-2